MLLGASNVKMSTEALVDNIFELTSPNDHG